MECPLVQRVRNLEEICTNHKGELDGFGNEIKMMWTSINAISKLISTRFVNYQKCPNPSITNIETEVKNVEPCAKNIIIEPFRPQKTSNRFKSRNSIFKRFGRRWKSTGSVNINANVPLKLITNYDSDVHVEKNSLIDTKTSKTSDTISNLKEMQIKSSSLEKQISNPVEDSLKYLMPTISTKSVQKNISRTFSKHEEIKSDKTGKKDEAIKNNQITESVSTSSELNKEEQKNCDSKSNKEGRRGRPKKYPEEKVKPSQVKTPMVCDECGKVLKGSASLRCHKKIHSNARPYECHICKNKAFRMKHHLDFHIKIHEGDKNWTCKFCNKGFLARRDLLRHERTHTGERPFACSYPSCTKSFNVKQHLTMHYRTHTGERNYKCLACNKTFTQANSLRIHKKIHSKGSEELEERNNSDKLLSLIKEKDEQQESFVNKKLCANPVN